MIYSLNIIHICALIITHTLTSFYMYTQNNNATCHSYTHMIRRQDQLQGGELIPANDVYNLPTYPS